MMQFVWSKFMNILPHIPLVVLEKIIWFDPKIKTFFSFLLFAIKMVVLEFFLRKHSWRNIRAYMQYSSY